MDILGLTHMGTGFGAILSGAHVALTTKGTRRHRFWGRLYVGLMLGLNTTGLLIYDLTGRFGPFHWAALASLATVIAGLLPAFRKRPQGLWISPHAHLMSWSYLGLLAAGVSEATSRIPTLPFWPAVGASSLAVFLVGAGMIRRHVPNSIRAVLSNYRKG